jgi:hypothetical protein
MLRQSLPLEAAYYYLATQTNIALAQLTLLRDLYREALQGRNAFLAEAAEFGGPPMRDRNDGREEFEAKVQAFGTRSLNVAAVTRCALAKDSNWRGMVSLMSFSEKMIVGQSRSHFPTSCTAASVHRFSSRIRAPVD